MITDFLKSMFPVDLNPPSGVPYIGCGEMGRWGDGVWGVGYGVWGVGCGVWGDREIGKWGNGEMGKWGDGVVGCGV